MTKAATQAQTIAAPPPSAQGVLMRKCECGNHTIAGGECGECGKERHRSFNQGAVDASFAVPRVNPQSKIILGSASDPLEQEADRVADSVFTPAGVSGMSPPQIQRYSDPPANQSSSAVPGSVERVLSGSGRQLDPTVRHDMERRLGHDFSRVRVHTGTVAEQSALEMSARAYTVGDQIVFGSGEFAPHTQSGQRLLAHELTHVVQQSTHQLFDGAEFPISTFPRAKRLMRAVVTTKVDRLNKTKLLGDGTAANPGLVLREFQEYIAKQADWFTEPTIAAVRDKLWKFALMLSQGEHVTATLGELKMADLIAATDDEMKHIDAFTEGGEAFADQVRITNPPANIARVIKLGEAMTQLATFVPGPVLRLVIDQATLEALVDENLIPTFKDYYKDFTPTIEEPREKDSVLALLRGGLALFSKLVDWVHDLHVFTIPTRTKLAANVTDKSRKKPVLLILFSGMDWNAAFHQKTNLETAVLNPKNLALVIQGAKTLKDETTMLNKVADDYGQIPKAGAKGRLGQVVIAGHGSAGSVEQATEGKNPFNKDEKYVKYDQEELAPKTPGDDSELLIDALLQRMDPKDARVVFAGCLVGSHDIPETPGLSNTKTAAAEINAALKAKPNLRDMVNERMRVLKIKGSVQAANASTTFGAFNVDPATGKARLHLDWDPDVGGSKKDYVKTGAEPEGALRAALETWADPKLGPAWTTKTMRDHVTATKASKDWWVSLTRTAFELALPKAGDVDPALLANLAHRVEKWLLAGWTSTANAEKLAISMKPTEAAVVYPVMLASDHKTYDHLPIVVEQAWMEADVTHEANFLAALDATPLKRLKLTPLIKDGVVNKHLASLLKAANPAAPSRPQLLLAVVIAVSEGVNMPAEVKKFLGDAAGNVRSTSFPAALGLRALLDGASEIGILNSINLAPGSTTPSASMVGDDKANVDLDKDDTNETFVTVSPRQILLDTFVYVRSRPNRDAGSKMLDKLNAGQKIKVVGETGAWTMIDYNGRVGFINKKFPH